MALLSPDAAGVTQHLWGFAEGLGRRGCSSHGDAVFLEGILNGRLMLSKSDHFLSAFLISERGPRQP